MKLAPQNRRARGGSILCLCRENRRGIGVLRQLARYFPPLERGLARTRLYEVPSGLMKLSANRRNRACGTRIEVSLLGISLIWGMVVGGLWPRLIEIREKTRTMADDHRKHKVAHPGWSFPARVWSDSASIDLPKDQLVQHARLRDYRLACPAREPGEYCDRTGSVIPRGGIFPEGQQPAGMAGWTRPIALEPIMIGYLIGTDGEVREHLPMDEAPEHLIDAIIAAEDEDFEPSQRQPHG